MNTKAILTGVPGWLGNALSQTLMTGLADNPEIALPRHSQISVLMHPEASLPAFLNNQQIEVFKADLANLSDLSPLFKDAAGGTVFHIAGVIHPQKSTKEFYNVNVMGTKALLDAAIKAGVRRFIYVSSNSPCGCNETRQGRFTEAAPYNPYLGYGKSKMQAEELILQAYKEGKIEVVIVRPPWFYGPHQPPRQTLFFKMIKDGKVPMVGDGGNMRSMAYVDNICQALLLAETTQAADGQIYWIADAEPYSMQQIVETIEDVLEKDFQIPVAHKRMHLPSIASEVAYLVDSTLQAAGLYQQKIHVLSEMNKTIACDISKARSQLGYNPKIALREGMRRSIEWIHKNGGVI